MSGGIGRQRVVPSVPPDRLQEQVQLADAIRVDLPAGELGVQIGQETFQQGAVDLVEPVDGDRR